MSAGNLHNLRQRGITLLSAILSLFILYTCATGPFESIIQRAIFLAILICLGVLYYPLWEGKTRWRPAGDGRSTPGWPSCRLPLASMSSYNYDLIMTTLPMAKTPGISS